MVHIYTFVFVGLQNIKTISNFTSFYFLLLNVLLQFTNECILVYRFFEMTDDREGEDGDRRRTSDTPGMGTVYRHVQVTHPTYGSIRTFSLLLF